MVASSTSSADMVRVPSDAEIYAARVGGVFVPLDGAAAADTA
jgi:hypothetical protein